MKEVWTDSVINSCRTYREEDWRKMITKKVACVGGDRRDVLPHLAIGSRVFLYVNTIGIVAEGHVAVPWSGEANNPPKVWTEVEEEEYTVGVKWGPVVRSDKQAVSIPRLREITRRPAPGPLFERTLSKLEEADVADRISAELSKHRFSKLRSRNRATARDDSWRVGPATNTKFSLEPTGSRKPSKHDRQITSEQRHGKVVNELAKRLTERGLHVANDKPRDLYVLDKHKKIKTLFEVKTDISTGSLYTAVGQLMLHAAAEVAEPKQIVILPAAPPKLFLAAISRLGIKVITYKQRQRGVVFPSLDGVV